MTVPVNGRTPPERDAAKALAIARSGRAICYVGQWRHIAAIERRLPAGDDGIVVALHRNPDGSGALIVGPARGDGTVPLPANVDPARAAGWESMAPLADRI